LTSKPKYPSLQANLTTSYFFLPPKGAAKTSPHMLDLAFTLFLYIRRKIGTVETPFFFKKHFCPSFLVEMHIYALHDLTGILEDKNMRNYSEEEEWEEEKEEEEEEEEW
jgi:hypothetical protein